MKIEMHTETQYCLFDFRGDPVYSCIRYYRGCVEKEYLSWWDKKSEYHSWKYWYKRGWRIRKVEVIITTNIK